VLTAADGSEYLTSMLLISTDIRPKTCLSTIENNAC
jgi:hypothetical protein